MIRLLLKTPPSSKTGSGLLTSLKIDGAQKLSLIDRDPANISIIHAGAFCTAPPQT
jgi:hypothetical protein